MENRIDRKEDESLYRPKVHSERIRALYHSSKRRESSPWLFFSTRQYGISPQVMALIVLSRKNQFSKK